MTKDKNKHMWCCICKQYHIAVGETAIAVRVGNSVKPAHPQCLRWHEARQKVEKKADILEEEVIRRFKTKHSGSIARTKRSNQGRGIKHWH